MQYLSLEESNPLIKDPSKLKNKLDQDGYLFFRSILNPEKVLKVKKDFVKLLRRYDLVDKDAKDEPYWTRGPISEDDDRVGHDSLLSRDISSLKSFRNLAKSKEIIDILECLAGGKIWTWPLKVYRTHFPNDKKRDAPLHQDMYYFPFYQKMEHQFYTAWVPLMDIDEKVGGLGIIPRIHKTGKVKDLGSLHDIFSKGAVYDDSSLYEAGDKLTPARIDYRVGDVVIFRGFLQHMSLPNISNTIRLSADYRYQLEGTPRYWQTLRTDYYVNRVRTKTREVIVDQMKLSGEDYDKVSSYMEKNGSSLHQITVETVKKLLKELK